MGLFSVRELLLMFLALLTFICFIDLVLAKTREDRASKPILFSFTLGSLLVLVSQEISITLRPNQTWLDFHYAAVITKHWGVFIIPGLGLILNCGFWAQLISGMGALLVYVIFIQNAISWVVTIWIRVFDFVTSVFKYCKRGIIVLVYWFFVFWLYSLECV